MNDAAHPMRILIVDDEAPARSRLRDLLMDCQEQMPVDIVGEACNGMEALDKINCTHIDLVFSDIRMPQMDGVELARHLQKLSAPPIIIFTTAYDKYAIQAFELHAIDYLLKPIRLRRLFESLTRARDVLPSRMEALDDLLPEARKHLSIQERGKIILVPIEDILCLRAEQKYITVKTRDHEYLIEESLSSLETEFFDHFIRIHRNCLVARDAIASLEKSHETGESGWVVRLRDLDETLAVSRRQQQGVKELLKQNQK